MHYFLIMNKCNSINKRPKCSSKSKNHHWKRAPSRLLRDPLMPGEIWAPTSSSPPLSLTPCYSDRNSLRGGNGPESLARADFYALRRIFRGWDPVTSQPGPRQGSSPSSTDPRRMTTAAQVLQLPLPHTLEPDPSAAPQSTYLSVPNEPTGTQDTGQLTDTHLCRCS